MSSSDVTESGDGSNEKDKEKDTENPVDEEDFVVIDPNKDTYPDYESSVPFSVSTNQDFLSNTTKDNKTAVELVDVQNETSKERHDVKENAEKIQLDKDSLKLRPEEKDKADNETEQLGLVENKIVTTETTKERVDMKVEIDQLSSSVDMLNFRPVTQDNVQNESNIESLDVKENTDKISLDNDKVNLREDNQKKFNREPQIAESTDEEIKGKITTTFEAISSPDGQEIVNTETVEAASPAIEENIAMEENIKDKKITTFYADANCETICGDGLTEVSETDSQCSDLENNQCIDTSENRTQQNKVKEGTMKKLGLKALNYAKGFLYYEQTKDIDLLVIGKTGNGKSRTGNTILQKEFFKYTDSFTSVTQDVQQGFVQYNKRRIKVVDCPGIEDTGNMVDVEKTTSYLIEKMGDAVTQHPDGYHAFLLVVRYGGRFTKEDKCVISTLKSIFGEEIISQFSILLMTYGDIFHIQNKTKKTLKQWCSEQTGVVKELMEECGNRVVMFDNETKDPLKINSQMKELTKTIDNLQSRGMRYNHDYFQRAVKNREHLLVAVKEPRILEETNKECSIIYNEMEKLENDFSDECIEKLKCLQQRAYEIKNKVKDEDNRTGALIKALELIDSSCRMIANRLQVIIAFRQKESQIEEERTSLLKLHDERMNNLIESYEQKRDQDAKRTEIERKEIEKKWLEQEERMQANLKRTLDSVESEKNAYQLRMKELEKECMETKAEARNQVEEKIAVLQSSMNGLMERETKEKQALQEELNRMRILQQEEQKRYNENVKEELKKVTDSFLIKQKELNDQHETEIINWKKKEETLIEEKKRLTDDLQKEKDTNATLQKELSSLKPKNSGKDSGCVVL